jgi:flavin reductase ActVB
MSPDLFRKACGQFATGVTIVTVRDAEGRPHGFTASSFTSVSLNPPLVLVCIDFRNNLLDLFQTQEFFGVNILSRGQELLARKFAARGVDRFEGALCCSSEVDVPLLEGSLATLACRRAQGFESGDHWILVGEAVEIGLYGGQPLIWYDSGFRD